MSKIYINTVGARLVISTKNLSIPSDAILAIHIKKPSGTMLHKYTLPSWVNYTTGVITYYTIAGDVDELGQYKVQVHEVATGVDIPSDIDTFIVYEKLVLIEPVAKDIYGKFTVEV